MQAGFPLDLLPLLACPRDAAPLQTNADVRWLRAADVTCTACGSRYAIEEGVLSLMAGPPAHPESAREQQTRDALSIRRRAEGRDDWTSPWAEANEVAPTLAALATAPGDVVADIGCGAGRYTVRLLDRARAIVAVDFSVRALGLLRDRLPEHAPVALVQADVTAPVLAAGAFTRLLSTLHSNLPTADHRDRCLAMAAAAVGDEGRCVISMHHYGLRDWLTGEPRAGHYRDNGIFRYYFGAREARERLTPWFAEVRLRYIHATLPGVPLVAVARRCAEWPLLRGALSRVLLGICERPKRYARGQHQSAGPLTGTPRR